ncbi:MAG: MFS transporter, partial [Saprospiraceae bacterium]|nr:MFS transporter [Saprospiraceae bacterium]
MNNISINEASKYGGYLLLLCCCTIYIFDGDRNLSDRFGRRPVLLLSLLGFSVNYLILALRQTSGGFCRSCDCRYHRSKFTTASAYIADISTPETDLKNFGMISCGFRVGVIICALFLGGVLGQYGVKNTAFNTAACLSFANFIYGYFILPESLA